MAFCFGQFRFCGGAEIIHELVDFHWRKERAECVACDGFALFDEFALRLEF